MKGNVYLVVVCLYRRTQAIGSYCEQLGLMERLRHEVILLHSKVSPQHVHSMCTYSFTDRVRPGNEVRVHMAKKFHSTSLCSGTSFLTPLNHLLVAHKLLCYV